MMYFHEGEVSISISLRQWTDVNVGTGWTKDMVSVFYLRKGGLCTFTLIDWSLLVLLQYYILSDPSMFHFTIIVLCKIFISSIWLSNLTVTLPLCITLQSKVIRTIEVWDGKDLVVAMVPHTGTRSPLYQWMPHLNVISYGMSYTGPKPTDSRKSFQLKFKF